MSLLKQMIKFVSILTLILSFAVFSGIVGLIPFSRWQVQHIRSSLLHHFSRWGLHVIGVKIDVIGKIDNLTNHLLISNHLSYLDILIISSLRPSCFVTSVEIKESFGLGPLTKIAGCLFVERRSRQNLSQEINEITEGLRQGLSVTIFPEATSTNGEQVIRFKRPLYAAAIEAEKSVLPLCLNYTSIDGKSVSLGNRDKVFWYGDMDFLPHLWNLLAANSVSVSVIALDTIPTYDNHSLTCAELAEQSHQLVSQSFVPCLV
jgi:1-acyl-sn-glycerol-3-phosphate acyltransferase